MTVTRQRLTFEEYLTYDDGSDTRYEFDDGELIEMPPAIRLHRRIAQFLEECFQREIDRLGLQWETGRTEVGVKTQKLNGRTTVRYPDLLVFNASSLDGAEVDIIDFAPEIAIEIVSTGSKNRKRDYEEKRYEYRARGIREYWIIDPAHQKVTVLLLNDEADFYEQEEYRNAQVVPCGVFSEVKLTAAQILLQSQSSNSNEERSP
ncbi:MAG: Uma2 family endonuclease [Leptolyngbyaceae cyanobacterium SM1_3_5]|nr:Uma2 family endonuclease [Leptolyngbyaceae cyanobacterium SM1_3_5]